MTVLTMCTAEGETWAAYSSTNYGLIEKIDVVREMAEPTKILLKMKVNATQFTNWRTAASSSYYIGVRNEADDGYLGFGKVTKIEYDIGAHSLTVEAFGPLADMRKKAFGPYESVSVAAYPIKSVSSETVITVDISYPQPSGALVDAVVNDQFNGLGLAIVDRTRGGSTLGVKCSEVQAWEYVDKTEAPTYGLGADDTIEITSGDADDLEDCDSSTLNFTFHTVGFGQDMAAVFVFSGITAAQKAATKRIEVVFRNVICKSGRSLTMEFLEGDDSAWKKVGEARQPSDVTNKHLINDRVFAIVDDDISLADYFKFDDPTYSIRLGVVVDGVNPPDNDWLCDQVYCILHSVGKSPPIIVPITDFSVSGTTGTITCSAGLFQTWNVSAGADVADDDVRDLAVILPQNLGILGKCAYGLIAPSDAPKWSTYALGFLDSDIGGKTYYDVLKRAADIDGVLFWESPNPTASTSVTGYLYYADPAGFTEYQVPDTDVDFPMSDCRIGFDYSGRHDAVMVYGDMNPSSNRPYYGVYPSEFEVVDGLAVVVEDRALVSDGACMARAKGLYDDEYGDGKAVITYLVDPVPSGYDEQFNLGVLNNMAVDGDFASYNPAALPIRKASWAVKGTDYGVSVELGTGPTMGEESWRRRINTKLQGLSKTGYQAPRVMMVKCPTTCDADTCRVDTTAPTINYCTHYTNGGRTCVYVYTDTDGKCDLSSGHINFTLPANYREGGLIIARLVVYGIDSGSNVLKLGGYVGKFKTSLTNVTSLATWPTSGSYDVTSTQATWTDGADVKVNEVWKAARSNELKPGDQVWIYFTANAVGTASKKFLVDGYAWCEVIL